MANKFLKRAMEIVREDLAPQYAKQYGSNLMSLKNEAKAVINQVQSEPILSDVQNNYKRIKSGAIFKDISKWFYGNADELDAEAGRDDFDFGMNDDDKDETPTLNIPSASESSKHLSAMYKIGAKQAEAALANTAEIVTTINTRSSEIVASINTVNRTLEDIKHTLDDKLSALVRLSTVRIEQAEEYRNNSMVDNDGKLSLSKIYEAAKSSNRIATDPNIGPLLGFLPMLKEMGGQLGPGDVIKYALDNLVLGNNKIQVKGQTLDQWGKTFDEFTGALTQRLLRSFTENETVKKYLFNNEANTGGNTDYSQYRVDRYNDEKAIFDNMTRQSIVSIIPGYLKSIDNALNKRELNIDRYGQLTTEDVSHDKFGEVTSNALLYDTVSDRHITKMQNSFRSQGGMNISDQDMNVAIKALQGAYIMYLEHSGGYSLKLADLSPNNTEILSYALQMIQTAIGGSEAYWLNVCQSILLTLSTKVVEGEKFIQGVSAATVGMRKEAIDTARDAKYGNQAGQITDAMMQNSFNDMFSRYSGNRGGSQPSAGSGSSGGGNPPSSPTPPTPPKPSDATAEIVDSLMEKLSSTGLGQFLRLPGPTGGEGGGEGTPDYVGNALAVVSNVKSIGTNLTSAAKNSAKLAINTGLARAKEAATDKINEVTERVAFNGARQDFNETGLAKASISDEDKLLVQQIMQMAQTATADGEVSQADIQAIKQMIGQIQDANTKKRLNQSIIPMLNRVNSKNSEDGSGQNKGIVGKILAGVTLAFNKILTPIKAVIKLGFRGLKTVATKLFAPIIKLFKSGASDVISGGSALKESLFGSKDEEGNRTDGLMQTFVTNPAKSVLGVGKSIVSALHTGVVKPLTSGIADTFKNIFAERDKAEKDKPKEDSEKATDKVVDKFKDFMNSSEFGKGFMSVFNKEEEKKKAAKLKTPESMSDVATNEMSEMISGKKESIFTVIRDAILEVAENTGSKGGKKGKRSGSKSKVAPETASEAVAGEEGAAVGGKGKVSSLFNIGKMLGGITKILAGFGKMILSAIAGLSGVKAIMTLVEKALSKAVKPLNKAFNTIKKVLTPIINTISNSLTKVMDTVSKMAISVVKVLQPIFENIGPIIEMLFDAINPLLEAITPILAPALEVIVSVLKPVLAVLTPTLNMITGILQTVSGSLKFIVGGVKYIVGALKHDNNLKEEGKVLVESGLDNLKDGLGNVFNPTGAKVEEETASSYVQQNTNTTYEPIKGNVLDGTLTGSGDYNSVAEATAAPIVSVLREELIPQIKPIVDIMTKWLTPVLVNIDKALTTVGSFVKTFTSGFNVLKGAVMSGVGFLIQSFDGGKLLKAGVSAIKQGFSSAFTNWKEGVSSVVKNIPVVGDIIDVYTDEEGNEVQVVDETGSGNMASYGTYMNMAQRGCGPLALSENINRRGGHVSAMSLAGGMGMNGSYDPNRGTSVNGYINTARSMGMNLTPGTVTRESLMTASSRNPITVLGSGSSYGTQSGNNHYVNVIGSRGGQVYVSNPLTGRISRENASDFIAGSKVGLYGSGDFSFSEDVTDAMSSLKEITSGIFDIFKFDDDSDSYASIQEQQKESEAVTAADELLESQGVRITDYEAKAYEQFQKDHPKHVWQSDKSYAKKWNKYRNKYLLEAAKDDISSAYQAEYKNREADADYDADGSILSALVNGAKNFFSGLTSLFKGGNSGGSTSGSSATAEKFISLAESDVGKNRSAVNCTSSTGGTDGDWCANYVSQVMKRSGYSGPYNLTVGYLLKAMQESDDWQEVDKDKAERGDVVFFDWDNPNPEVDPVYNEGRRWDHVGWILDNNNGDSWTCIEGNAGGAQSVTKQTRYNPYVDTIMRFVKDRTYGSYSGDTQGKINMDSSLQGLSGFGSGYRSDPAALTFVKQGLEAGLSPAEIATVFATGLWEDSCKKLFGTKSLSEVTYDKNGQAAVGLLNFVDTGRMSEYGYTIPDQLKYIRDTYFGDNPTHSRGYAVDPYNSEYPWGRTFEYYAGKTPSLTVGSPIGPRINSDLIEGASYFVGGAVVPDVAAIRNSSKSDVVMKYSATAADIYNWMIDQGLFTPTGNPTATDFIGPVMPDSLKNVDLNKYDEPIGPGMTNVSGNKSTTTASSNPVYTINTGDEVIFTTDAKGKTFKQDGFGGTLTVGDLYYAKGPWRATLNKNTGRYNLKSVSDSNYGIDGVPASYLALYRTNSMVQNNVKPASLYGSGDIPYTVGDMYGNGDITDFLMGADYTPTTNASPTYQVVNSSYDGMSREQMISSLSKIEFNVSAKRLEYLVEQVIDRLDKKQPADINIGTKNTNSTQSMFNEEIPNQLMKLYT